MTDYKFKMHLNHRITSEIKYIHLREAIEEAQLRFLLASCKSFTFTLSGNVQSNFLSKNIVVIPK